MKKILLITIILIINTINNVNSGNIIIDNNNSIIDTTNNMTKIPVLFPGNNHSKFDLFKINIPDDIEIIKHTSKTTIFLKEFEKEYISHLEWKLSKINYSQRPKILDFFIEKLWRNKVRSIIDKWILHVIWDYNKTESNYHKYSSDYYLWEKQNTLEWNILEIQEKYLVNSEVDKNIKIMVNPFEKNIFLGYRLYAEPPYPLLSIFDNSLLPQEFKIVINKKTYYPKIKYTLQWYKINTDKWTQKSYVFIPYYEFNIDMKKWDSIIELVYFKYNWDNKWIITIQEIYKK